MHVDNVTRTTPHDCGHGALGRKAMTEPNPCPWCNKPPKRDESHTTCVSFSCHFYSMHVPNDVWDSQLGVEAAVQDAKRQIVGDVEDACGCDGGPCWCIRNALASIREEVAIPAGSVSITLAEAKRRAVEAVRTMPSVCMETVGGGHFHVNQEDAIAAIEAAFEATCKTCRGHPGIMYRCSGEYTQCDYCTTKYCKSCGEIRPLADHALGPCPCGGKGGE